MSTKIEEVFAELDVEAYWFGIYLNDATSGFDLLFTDKISNCPECDRKVTLLYPHELNHGVICDQCFEDLTVL